MSRQIVSGSLPSGALLIGERRISQTSSGFHSQINPSTGELLAETTIAGPIEIDQAVKSAREAIGPWRAFTPIQRRDVMMRLADLLEKNSEEFSILRSIELGAPMKKSKGANMAVEYIKYFAGWVDKLEGVTIPINSQRALNYTMPEPYGVVAALTPWNGGIVSMAMKVVPALVAGNTVVLKPSELATLANLRFGELFLEAGFPPGALNIVPGGVSAGEALVKHPGVDKVSFTGGSVTARHILMNAAINLTPVILELGGKSANILFSDGDVQMAATTTVELALAGMSGQGCVLPTRMLVQEEIYEEVEELVVRMTKSLIVGRPFDEGVQAGPVITEESCNRILQKIEDARKGGDGKILTGGNRIGGDLAKGFFIQPTVFGDVDNASSLAQEEFFGPVLSIMRFRDESDAIRLANESRFGLGGLVFTRDIGRAHRVANQLEVGSVGVNAFPPMPPSAPFGGVKQSGFGREGGLAGVNEFLRTKNVYVRLDMP